MQARRGGLVFALVEMELAEGREISPPPHVMSRRFSFESREPTEAAAPPRSIGPGRRTLRRSWRARPPRPRAVTTASSRLSAQPRGGLRRQSRHGPDRPRDWLSRASRQEGGDRGGLGSFLLGSFRFAFDEVRLIAHADCHGREDQSGGPQQ